MDIKSIQYVLIDTVYAITKQIDMLMTFPFDEPYGNGKTCREMISFFMSERDRIVKMSEDVELIARYETANHDFTPIIRDYMLAMVGYNEYDISMFHVKQRQIDAAKKYMRNNGAKSDIWYK